MTLWMIKSWSDGTICAWTSSKFRTKTRLLLHPFILRKRRDLHDCWQCAYMRGMIVSLDGVDTLSLGFQVYILGTTNLYSQDRSAISYNDVTISFVRCSRRRWEEQHRMGNCASNKMIRSAIVYRHIVLLLHHSRYQVLLVLQHDRYLTSVVEQHACTCRNYLLNVSLRTTLFYAYGQVCPDWLRGFVQHHYFFVRKGDSHVKRQKYKDIVPPTGSVMHNVDHYCYTMAWFGDHDK